MSIRRKLRGSPRNQGPPFTVTPTSGGQGSDIIAVFGDPGGASGAANNDATSRSRLPATTSLPGRGLVRATFKAAAGSALTVDNASVGVWDGVAAKADTLLTPIELKFAGASGFALGAGAKITSDWAVVAGITQGSSIVIVVDYGVANGNAVASAGKATPAANYLHAASNSFNTTVTTAGSTELLNSINDVIKVEVN